jgi:hypothetical protein
MTNLLVTIRSLLLLAARLLLYMGIALVTMAALRAALAGAIIVFHHLTAR